MLYGGVAITPATRVLSLPDFNLGLGSGTAWVASSRAALDKEPNWRYAAEKSGGPVYVALSSISRLKDGSIVVQTLDLHKDAKQADGEAYQATLAVWIYHQDSRQARVVKVYLQDRKLNVVHASALMTDRPFEAIVPDSIDKVGRIARANVR
jgi:hypothetical protein